jgi:hypothetical protein
MKRIYSIVILLIFLLVTPIFAIDLANMQKDFRTTNDCCQQSYLQEKYGVSDYKKSKEFKFRLCGAETQDC